MEKLWLQLNGYILMYPVWSSMVDLIQTEYIIGNSIFIHSLSFNFSSQCELG